MPVLKAGEVIRCYGFSASTQHRRIRLGHDIFQGIGPAFRMTAGQMRICFDAGRDQRWILRYQLISLIAVAQPQLVRRIGIPTRGRA